MTLHSPVHMPDFSAYMDSLGASAVGPSPHKPMLTDFELPLVKYLQLSWSLVAAELCLYGEYICLVTRRLAEYLAGGYVAMMMFYLHVLRMGRLARNRFLVAATITLFILCTIHCFLLLVTAIMETRDLVSGDFWYSRISYLNLEVATNVVYVTSKEYLLSVIADTIFTFRCYAIWNSRLKIVLLPIFLTLLVALLGYCNVRNLLVSDDQVLDPTMLFLSSNIGGSLLLVGSIVLSVFTTAILMGLSLGRIWWFSRAARDLMGKEVVGKYHPVVAMILESGALYFTGGLVFVVLFCEVDLPKAQTGIVLGQLVGIAPTIIAVRVGLGYSIESVESFIGSEPLTQIRFNSASRAVDEGEDHTLALRVYLFASFPTPLFLFFQCTGAFLRYQNIVPHPRRALSPLARLPPPPEHAQHRDAASDPRRDYDTAPSLLDAVIHPREPASSPPLPATAAVFNEEYYPHAHSTCHAHRLPHEQHAPPPFPIPDGDCLASPLAPTSAAEYRPCRRTFEPGRIPVATSSNSRPRSTRHGHSLSPIAHAASIAFPPTVNILCAVPTPHLSESQRHPHCRSHVQGWSSLHYPRRRRRPPSPPYPAKKWGQRG
ncbi:hypothetical protein MVEN_02169100 [Mycena venus]|uniref:Uncharacterized protein n=1 Tax=Mycena venus TaxID=2733690 RepID=A0A8H6X7X3_9AGAR|nr:hypothetical protein MVEN_02169100 [Mycena venus]